jgi:hypothetical protein
MKRDLLVIILFSLLAVAFAVILFLKNQKDKKELENKLNTDYKKPRDDHEDIETEDKNKV